MRAAIVGNGRLPATRGLRQLLRHADLVVCADGGLRVMRALGITPEVAVGDFDSASPSLLAWARRRGTRLLAHPRDRDKSDTELAMQYALRAGATTIDLIGVLGDRVSLIPLSARATGISTHGLKYPLAHSTLRMDATRGISNEITASPAHVRTRRGWLLIVVEHRS